MPSKMIEQRAYLENLSIEEVVTSNYYSISDNNALVAHFINGSRKFQYSTDSFAVYFNIVKNYFTTSRKAFK